MDTLDHVLEHPEKTYTTAQELFSAIEALDARLQKESLSSEDETTRSGLISDIAADAHRIEQVQTEYNEAAQQFNDTLTRFPTRLLSKIVGIQPVELYA